VLLLEDAAKNKSKEVSEPRPCTCMHGGKKSNRINSACTKPCDLLHRRSIIFYLIEWKINK
jgi:hypothetical protein